MNSRPQIQNFEPITRFWSGHIQTLLGHFLTSPKWDFPTEKVKIELGDGELIEGEYSDLKGPYTLVLMHGLGGGRRSDYMERTAVIGSQLGWNVLTVDHRGAGEHLTRKTYHSGRGEDASDIISWCRKRDPRAKIFAVGFSMSGSILLNLLTGKRGTEKPDYACVVNAPIDLLDASDNLMKGFSRVYDFRFYRLLKELILKRGQIKKLPLFGTVRLLDELHTSRLNDFLHAEDYYQKCSTIDSVDKINTPTFVLTAEDDPFVKSKNYLKAQWSQFCHVTIAKSGGHMGYISRQSHKNFGRRWLDYYFHEIFSSVAGTKTNRP